MLGSMRATLGSKYRASAGGGVEVAWGYSDTVYSWKAIERRYSLWRLECPSSGDVISGRVYLRDGNAERVFGVVLMDDTGTAIGHSSVELIPSGEGWESVTFSPAISVTAGTTYRCGAIGDLGVGGPDIGWVTKSDGVPRGEDNFNAGDEPTTSGWSPVGDDSSIDDDDYPLIELTIET